MVDLVGMSGYTPKAQALPKVAEVAPRATAEVENDGDSDDGGSVTSSGVDTIKLSKEAVDLLKAMSSQG